MIYPTAPQNKVERGARRSVKDLIEKYHVTLISVGNGTASRESEQIIVELLKEIPEQVQYVIVNEAGASVYSASKLATEEFPNFDVGQRSAASIARRLQDPLAELVKIDPKSIGVGQYQHDMNQKNLGEALQRCGGGLRKQGGRGLKHCVCIPAWSIFPVYQQDHCEKYCGLPGGKRRALQTAEQLLKVPKLGPKAFEQCAGFLRISGRRRILLDATSVHPESYQAAREASGDVWATM